jgi:hypothetical protein
MSPAEEGSILLVVENAAARAAMMARAEALPEGQCLVKVVDVVGLRRSVRTVPKDASRVRLVARETPVVLRGGLTSLISYHVAPLDALDAIETHLVEGEESHRYDVQLSIATVGRGSTAKRVPA